MKRAPTTLIFALMMMMACVEPYTPAEIKSANDFIVVDGFLNGSSGTANVKITHAIPLSENVPIPAEEGAKVTVESVNGSTFATLLETNKGVYTADNLNFDETAAYRLHVKTAGGSSYSSDFIKIKKSPMLDSVVWRGTDKGLQFYVNGHDPFGQTTFYRYLFTETWEFRVTYVSDWMKVGGTPVFRDPVTQQVYTCWRSTESQPVLTVSTRKLSEDVVSMYPINFIPKGSRMLSRTYSIIVQQRAISQEEFEFWDLIKKTTESLGGLFDPLPSQAIGNIQNDDNPSEQVLGYFTGGFVQEKRIFVNFAELPANLQTVQPYDFPCETRLIPYGNPEQSGTDVLLSTVGIPPTQWLVGTPNCSDCTSLSGSNVKPAYWPQ
jgi:hypothetical protein